MPNPEKFEFYRESVEYAKEAAKTVLPEKIKDWEDLGQSITKLAQEKKRPEFKKNILENWNEFAVSGVLQFDKQEGKQVLKPFTDLDGRCALGFLKEGGFDIKNLTYVRPGDYLKGAVNLDTGDKFGVVYEEPTYSLYFDHHGPETKKVTSTAEIAYKTLVGLRLIKKSEEYDRLADFVTKIDNRKYPAEEFLRSPKTILGLQKDLDFEKLLAYFKDHETPIEELTPKELGKYGLKEVAENQQKVVTEAMETLERMEKEGKIIDTSYGKVVVNENNELKVGASAAYVKYDGIINHTSGRSFAATFKEKDISEEELKEKLGDRFQGKIIRNKMWIYNEKEPLHLSLEEIIDGLRKENIKEQDRAEGAISEKHLLDPDNNYLSTTEITFKDKKGREVKFSSFLPRGYKFASFFEKEKNRVGKVIGKSKFDFNHEQKTVTYDDLTKKASLFALLHEIGHAWQPKQEENSFDSYTKNYQNRGLTAEDIKKIGKDPKDFTEMTIYDPYGKGTGGIDNDEPWFGMLVPKEIIQKYGKDWAAEERGAWAFALKKMRELKKQGITPEGTLTNLEELQSEIYSCLNTYQQTFEKEYKEKPPYFTKGKLFKPKDVSEYLTKSREKK